MTTTSHAISTHRPSRLAAALAGRIVLPAHGRYDEARQAWNLAFDQRPAAVVIPDSAADVAAAVLFAGEQGQRIAPQGTGHNPGPLGSLEDTILVRTDNMRRVQIDPSRRIARVEAGALWTDVTEAAARHGLAALQGSSPDVGVVGYTLGGGLSFLGRKFGLAANNVHAIELVTADGRLRRVDREHEPDLFWALRGGGGSFGVVTAVELQLFPLPEVYAGVLWYPISRAGEVLQAWRSLTVSDVPDELTTVGRLLNVPPIDEIPEPVRGKSFVVVEAIHTGDPRQADELLAPLRSLGPINDTIAPISIPELSHLHMDPEHPVPGVGDGMMLGALDEAAIEALVDVAGESAEFPLLSVEIRHLEGELARARPQNGALASLDAAYAMYGVGMTPVPELKAPTAAQVEAVKSALAPWSARHMYLNFAETSRGPAQFWSEQAYHRLRRTKAAVDPADVIRSNHPIPPAY